jgi:Fungal Zn(2)-Cys(6) binuclear cluster domain
MNCSRLGLECSNPPESGERGLSVGPTSGTTQAGTRRKRNAAPCNECRTAKAKCSDIRPPCARCRRLSLRCVYPHEPSSSGGSDFAKSPDGRALASPASFISPLPTTESSIPNHESSFTFVLCADDRTLPRLLDGIDLSPLLQCYFTKVHPLRCFGFIHEPTFMQALDRGTVGHPLLLAVCALASTYPHYSGPPVNGAKFAKESLDLIFGNLGNISVGSLMVLPPV